MTLREECKDMLAKMKKYCREKSYPFEIPVDDPDAAATLLTSAASGNTEQVNRRESDS